MKDKRKEKMRPPMVVWIFVAVLCSFLLSLFLGQGGMLRLREMRGHAEQMLMENHQLALENRRLSEEIRQLRENSESIEKIAREELHLVSPGDLVLLVPRKQ
jgi:cell division protein FtsB